MHKSPGTQAFESCNRRMCAATISCCMQCFGTAEGDCGLISRLLGSSRSAEEVAILLRLLLARSKAQWLVEKER